MRSLWIAVVAIGLAQAGAAEQLTLIGMVEIAEAARPEIIAAGQRVFVFYLEPSITGRSFKVKIYDAELTREIASKTLVTSTPEYGGPTDIRVVSDGVHAYAFYETATADRTYLWAAKYVLSDALETAAHRGPIASSTIFTKAKPGDEKLDDPAPMLADGGLYVMTRYESTLARDGETRYNFRKFDLNLNPLSEFEIDLSDYADGEARQASVLFEDGHYHIVMPTTTGDGNVVETVPWTVPSDVVMVKLDQSWRVVETKVIAQEEGYTEGYVTGLQSDRHSFYVTYCRVILGEEFSSVIKVFDKGWNAVTTEIYSTLWGGAGKGGGLRPSIEVGEERIYAGNNAGTGTTAQVYVFEKKSPPRRRLVAR